jgi:hypothetical protein
MVLATFTVVLGISALIIALLNVWPDPRESVSPPVTGETWPVFTPRPQPIKAKPGPVDKAVPVRVYNNSIVPGLGEEATRDFENDGWNSFDGGVYTQQQLLTSTAYYRPGTSEEAVAHALAAKFNLGTDIRFPGIEAYPPGVIVIVAGDYGGK